MWLRNSTRQNRIKSKKLIIVIMIPGRIIDIAVMGAFFGAHGL